MLLLLTHGGLDVTDAYYQWVVVLTGITGILTMIPAVYFYRRDKVCRLAGGILPSKKMERLDWKEAVWLFVMGAALAQYANILVGMLQIIFNITDYQDLMTKITDGKGIGMLILWMGIVAPIAEEMIFRWLIYLRLRDSMRVAGAAAISALIFGIYHGNVIQAVYAGILGAIFAWFLEMTGNIWSSVFLHAGANIWSLLLSEYGITLVMNQQYTVISFIYIFLLIAMVTGIAYFNRKGSVRKYRAV